jgi:hypothetical protein
MRSGEDQWHDYVTVQDVYGLNIGTGLQDSPPSPVQKKKKKIRPQSQFPELSAASNNDISEFEYEEEDDAITRNEGTEALKHAYRDETWSQKCFNYDPKPKEFLGRRGTHKFFERMPTIL